MAKKPDSANFRPALEPTLEAYAHRWTGTELRSFLRAQTSTERLQTHGLLALSRAMESKTDSSAGFVEVLLEQPEIPVNLPQIAEDGNTALHLAVLLQDIEAVRLLLARKDLDPNVGNCRGETPLHIATSRPRSPEILKLLLNDPRSNVAAVTSNKQTVMHVACKLVGNGRAASKDDDLQVANVVELLLNVLNVVQFLESSDEMGRTALHYAAYSGLESTISYIREREPSVSDRLALHATDHNGFLPVHLAAQKGHHGVLNLLLPLSERVLDMSTTSEGLNLYLELLVGVSHLRTAEFLFAAFFRRILHQEHVKEESECASKLLLWAVRAVFKVEDPVELKGSSHRALLIPHILKWRPGLANMTLIDKPIGKQTILHIATTAENESALQALCKESAPWDLDENRRDADGETALDYAFKTENKAIQRILRGRQDVKEHLARLHRKRATYAHASNAILVVAALIATLTYAKCTTVAELKKLESSRSLAPSSSPPSKSGTDYLEYATMPTRVAFLLAILSCLLAAFAALPFSFGLFFVQTTDDSYIRKSLYRTRVLIVLSSYCLVLSLGAVLFAFICSQYISPFLEFKCVQACKIALVVFLLLSVVFLSANVVTAFWSKWKRLREEVAVETKRINSAEHAV